jgi:DNA-binding transcriptional MerR regulator
LIAPISQTTKTRLTL